MKLLMAIVAVIVLGFGALFGLGLSAAMAFFIWAARREERTYRPVSATVLAKRLEQYTTQDSDGLPIVMSTPIVEYEYRVYDKSYTSTRVLSGGVGSQSGSWAQEIIGRFTVGQSVEAYYNQDEPSQSFLIKASRPRNDLMTYLLLLFGLAVVGMCGFFAWLSVRMLWD